MRKSSSSNISALLFAVVVLAVAACSKKVATPQARITGACSPGSHLLAIHEDGTVECEQSATPGAGLRLESGLLVVDAQEVQTRVSGTCAVGSSIRAIAEDGTVVCDSKPPSPAGGAVDVRLAATGGDGTAANPWTGWDTAITWKAHTSYVFPAGTYAYSVAPKWALNGIRLRGDDHATLEYLGTGDAVDFTATTTIFDLRFENFTILNRNPGTTTSNGLVVDDVHHSVFRNVRISNFGENGLWTKFTVLDTFDNVRVSVNEGDAVVPRVGFHLGTNGRPANGTNVSQANTFVTPVVEGAHDVGMWLENAAQTSFISGTSEATGKVGGGTGIGVQIDAPSYGNVFSSLDVEANTGEGVVLSGLDNTFVNLLAWDAFHFTSTSKENVLSGGRFGAVLIDAGASRNQLRNVSYGSITDNGVSTQRSDVRQTNRPLAITGTSWVDTIPQGRSNDAADLLRGGWTLSTTAPTTLSSTPLPAGTPWRAVFVGAFANDWEGTTLPQLAPFNEVTSDAPTLEVGRCLELRLSLAADNRLQGVVVPRVVAGCPNPLPTPRQIWFTGTVIVASYSQGRSGAASASFKGMVTVGSSTFPQLPASAPDGSLLYCSDCVATNPCAAGGTGAMAKRISGAWVCN